MNIAISKGLETLADGLRPVVSRRLRRVLGEDWLSHDVVRSAAGHRAVDDWDAHILLLLMWDCWNQAFRSDFSFLERCLVSELREVRNRWAHQQDFDQRDIYRCLDSIQRLLAACESSEAAEAERQRISALEDLYSHEPSHAELERDWFMVFVSSACGILTVFVMLTYLQDWRLAWSLSALATLVFGRIIIRSLKARPVSTSGPRQCTTCAKVYYGGTCPYCQPAAVFPAAQTQDVVSA